MCSFACQAKEVAVFQRHHLAGVSALGQPEGLRGASSPTLTSDPRWSQRPASLFTNVSSGPAVAVLSANTAGASAGNVEGTGATVASRSGTPSESSVRLGLRAINLLSKSKWLSNHATTGQENELPSSALSTYSASLAFEDSMAAGTDGIV